MGHTRGLQLGQSTTLRLQHHRGGFELDMNCGRLLTIPSLFRASCVVFLALAFTTSFGSSYSYIYYPKRNNDPLLNECIDRGGMERQLRSGNLNQYFSEMVNWLARCGRPRFGKRNGDDNGNILSSKNPEYNNENFIPYMYNLN